MPREIVRKIIVMSILFLISYAVFSIWIAVVKNEASKREIVKDTFPNTDNPIMEDVTIEIWKGKQITVIKTKALEIK